MELGPSFALSLVLGGALGLVIRALHRRDASSSPGSRGLANVFPLFVLGTILMIVVVQMSLALSLGLIGALTILRFRSPIKSPRELVYLLFCASIGLALGAGQPVLALAAVLVVALFIVFDGVFRRGAPEARQILSVRSDRESFFPPHDISGLERLNRITPFTLLRLDHNSREVEARGLVRVAATEGPSVLSEIRKEFPDGQVSLVDVDATQASGEGNRTSGGSSEAVHRAPPNFFEVIDVSPAGGTVDFVRREIKFALAHADSSKVRTILNVNCRHIEHGGAPVSSVQTLYFDDARLSACHENLDGVARRAKVRLRWYNQGDREGRLYFEIKRRVDSLVYKERLALRSRLPLADMSYDEILSELRRVLPGAARETLVSHSEPVVLSSYRREYFTVPGSPTRITLDESMVSYPQIGATRPSKRFGMRDDQLVILEVKFPPHYDIDLHALLYPLELDMSKSSKYVRACQRLGLFPVAPGSSSVPMVAKG